MRGRCSLLAGCAGDLEVKVKVDGGEVDVGAEARRDVLPGRDCWN